MGSQVQRSKFKVFTKVNSRSVYMKTSGSYSIYVKRIWYVHCKVFFGHFQPWTWNFERGTPYRKMACAGRFTPSNGVDATLFIARALNRFAKLGQVILNLPSSFSSAGQVRVKLCQLIQDSLPCWSSVGNTSFLHSDCSNTAGNFYHVSLFVLVWISPYASSLRMASALDNLYQRPS